MLDDLEVFRDRITSGTKTSFTGAGSELEAAIFPNLFINARAHYKN